MSSIQPESISELFCVCETIEYGCTMVTACPEIWVVGHILYWPPDGHVDRSKIVPPQSDWIPTMYRVLKSSIATFEEALMLEKRYSKHRDSASFQAAEAEKQLKRKHPVNRNEQIRSDLIDANSMVVSQIEKKQANLKARNVEPKITGREPKLMKYHGQCFKQRKSEMKPGGSTKTITKPAATVPRKGLNVHSKSKNIDLVKDTKRPRYENYLKSGNRNVHVEKKKVSPPPLMKMKKTGISATVTKAQFLKQNSIDQSEFEKVASTGVASTPIVQNNFQEEVEDFSDKENAISRKFGTHDKPLNSTVNVTNTFGENAISRKFGTRTHDKPLNSIANIADTFGFASNCDIFGLDNNDNAPICNGDKIKYRKNAEGKNTNSRVNIIEDVLITPATIDQSTHDGNNAPSDNIGMGMLSLLSEVKNLFKESEEKRIRFEARMQSQWELFTKKMILVQGQNDGEAEPIYDESDDFEDLDETFPLTYVPQVEELDWEIQSDLAYKRRMKNRLDQLGGKDENASIRAKMKYLIKDDVLERFTWRGTGEKKAFNKLAYLNNLIFRSVRSQFPKYNFRAFKTYMVQWIKHSRSRQRTVVYHYPNRNQRHVNHEEDDDEFEGNC